MTSLDALRRLTAERARSRALVIGAAVSLAWLVLVALFAWLAPEPEPEAAQTGFAGLLWFIGVLLPLALIWLAVWSARSLSILREEAGNLRAALAGMQEPGAAPEPAPQPAPSQSAPQAPRRRPPPPPPPPRGPATDTRQAALALDAPPVTALTGTEMFLALNFPDGPDDREAIRCLRLALADPQLARLIRAAQDVVTLLAGQGVYMDELQLPEADPQLWQSFAQGLRGEAVAGLAVIDDQAALDAAGAMLRGDEVFRDVAHHFLRHFDRLLSARAEAGDAQFLALLAETRSGRAFTLLAQVTGMLGQAETDMDLLS